jgi:hypothetical protein
MSDTARQLQQKTMKANAASTMLNRIFHIASIQSNSVMGEVMTATNSEIGLTEQPSLCEAAGPTHLWEYLGVQLPDTSSMPGQPQQPSSKAREPSASTCVHTNGGGSGT